MPLLQSHLHRVTGVEIHARHSTMSDLLRKNTRYPAPNLQSLRLELASVYRNLAFNDTVQLTTLFNEDTPSLRRLYLSSVAVPWTSEDSHTCTCNSKIAMLVTLPLNTFSRF